MTMPRRKNDRLQQILSWLQFRWPPPFPVKLSHEEPDVGYGEAYELERGPRVIYLQISPKLDGYHSAHTLIHEYAHALTWPVSKRQLEESPEHGPVWGAVYGELYAAFYDDGGASDAEDFDW